MGLIGPIRQLFGARGRRASPGEEQAALFRELTEQSSDMICRIGVDRAKYFSPASELLFGWTPDEMMKLRPDEFFLPEDMAILDEATATLRSGEADHRICQVRVTRKDGSIAWVETNTRLARDRNGDEPADLIVILRDITERKRHEEELAQLALTDPLTGIANRRAFEEAFERGWHETVARSGAMSLLLIDIDHFKKFNDHFGHQVGDECLRAVAAALCDAVRQPRSTTARFGGEEFAVVLPGIDSAEAQTTAEAARTAVLGLGIPHADGVGPHRMVTASIGAATALARSGASATMPGELLQAADTALYRAKHHGRNRAESALLIAGSSDEGA